MRQNLGFLFTNDVRFCTPFKVEISLLFCPIVGIELIGNPVGFSPWSQNKNEKDHSLTLHLRRFAVDDLGSNLSCIHQGFDLTDARGDLNTADNGNSESGQKCGNHGVCGCDLIILACRVRPLPSDMCNLTNWHKTPSISGEIGQVSCATLTPLFKT